MMFWSAVPTDPHTRNRTRFFAFLQGAWGGIKALCLPKTRNPKRCMFFERTKVGTVSEGCKWGHRYNICLLGFKTPYLQSIAVARATQGVCERCKKSFHQ